MPYYRKNLYVLSVTVFLAAVSWNQIMPFLPLFMKQMGVSAKMLPYWIGIVFAAQSLAGILAQPFWGKMGDSHGRKRMVLRAGICLTGIYFGMSFCQTPWQLAVLRFLNGALTGFIPGSFALIATNTPEDEAPHCVATAQSASQAGLIVGPALGGVLAGLVGYRGSMQLAGTAVLFSTFLVWRLVQEPNKVAPVEKTSLLQDFVTSVRCPVQASIMFAIMLAWVFGASISPYLTLHLNNLGGHVPQAVVGAMFSLPALAFLLSAHAWTRFGERWGYEHAISVGLVGGGIGALLLAFAPGLPVFAVLYFITGIWLAAIGPSVSAITCTRVDESFRGRAYGIQQSAGTLGALLAPLAAARIVATYDISKVFLFVGATFLLGWPVFRAMVGRWPKPNRDMDSA